jgi:hypothetical protein
MSKSISQEDRTKMGEAISTLLDISVKYNTPINLNIEFNSIDISNLSIKMLGTEKCVQWYPSLGQMSNNFRAANLICWLNYKLDDC